MKTNMMKSWALACLMILCCSHSSMAQHRQGDQTFQPRVGVTLSNLPGEENSKMKVNLSYGVEIEQFLTDQFSVAGGVLFTNQGCKVDDENVSWKINLYYSTFPITANYYLLPGLAVKAGLQPAFRVKAKIEEGGEKIDLDRAMQLIFEDDDMKINSFDLAIPLGLSYEFQGVTLDARYNLGLIKLFSGFDGNVRNSVFAITLGYKF